MKTVFFSLPELLHTDTSLKNTPSFEAVDNLYQLVINVLDPLRSAFKRPIYVNSGYRSTALNLYVKGAKNSQHLKGEAADITAGSKDLNKELFDLIIKLDLPFDQVIDEGSYNWIHISHCTKNRKQILHLG